MRTFYSAVVLAMHDGGSENVRLQDIYSRVEMFRPLTDHDREPHPMYPQENFKHTVRSILATLQEDKWRLVKYAGRAHYSLTKRALEKIDVFKNDNFGRSSGSEIDIKELLERLGRSKPSED